MDHDQFAPDPLTTSLNRAIIDMIGHSRELWKLRREREMSADWMLPQEREEAILAVLADQRKIAVSELSRNLKVSEATIRRDLRRLAARHSIQRVHGGAISVRTVEFEPPVLQRRSLHAEEKHRIGQAAAALINDGDTVVLIGGSTTLEVAAHLGQKKNVTIITDSLLIAESVAEHADITLIVLGGIVRHSELSMEGYLAQLCLKELHANKIITGVRAVNFQQGLMLDKVAEVETFRDSMRIADEVILVVDHSKFDQVGTAVLAPLTSINRIVTDNGMPPEISGKLRDLGIEVVLA